MRAPSTAVRVVVLLAAAACDDSPKAGPAEAGTASAPPPPPPPAREGCVRSGILEGLEADPACAVRAPNEDVVRAAMKRVSVTAAINPSEVVANGMALVTVTIKNTSDSETMVVFEARNQPPGPRPDWSRYAVPEPHGGAAEQPKIFFAVATTDAQDRDVDALPTVGPGAGTPTAYYGVYLRPGAKLTHVSQWWSLRIPAPAPIFKDDAGHRYTPKTSAQPLPPGEYNAVVDVPFAALSREERKLSAHVRVIKTPFMDGGHPR